MSIRGAGQTPAGSNNFSCLIWTIICQSEPKDSQIMQMVLKYFTSSAYASTVCKGPSPSRKTELATAEQPLGFDNVVPCFHICPELDISGLKYYQDTTWGQIVSLAFPLLCSYFHSGLTDNFCTTQENNSVIINKGWQLMLLRETSLSEVGLCNSLFELLSHSHKKASLTKATESSEHLFRQQNWKTDFLSCVITHTHTLPQNLSLNRVLWHTSETFSVEFLIDIKILKDRPNIDNHRQIV